MKRIRLKKFSTKTKLYSLLYLLFFISSVIGSNLYVIDSMLSLRNILFIILIFSLPLLYNEFRLNKNQLLILIPLILLLLVGIFTFSSQLPQINSEILKDFFYFWFLPVLLILPMLIFNNERLFFIKRLITTTKFVFYLLLITVLLESLFNIHLSSHSNSSALSSVPTAFFTNSNDLAVFTFALFLFYRNVSIFSESKIQHIVLAIITGYILFVTLSRFTIVLFIIYFIFLLLRRIKLKRILSIILICGVLLTLFPLINKSLTKNKIYERSIQRFESLTEVAKRKNNKGTSENLRLSIYRIPFENFSKFIIGYGFYSDAKVMENYYTGKLSNSHSFLIQLVFYFGWIGLIIILFFFFTIFLYSFTKNLNRFSLLFFIFAQISIINIPSSIIRMPIIWMPFFFYIAFITSNRNFNEENLSSNISSH